MKLLYRFLLFSLLFSFLSTSISFASADKRVEQWKQVYSDRYGIYSLEIPSISPRMSDDFWYFEVWYKQEFTSESLQDIASHTKNASQEQLNDIFNMGSIVTFAQICPKRWEYIPLKRIVYDKNNKVLHMSDEDPAKAPPLKFKPGHAIDAIAKEAIKITIEKSQQQDTLKK